MNDHAERNGEAERNGGAERNGEAERSRGTETGWEAEPGRSRNEAAVATRARPGADDGSERGADASGASDGRWRAEQGLVRRLQTDDRAAFDELYEQHRDAVIRYVQGWLRDSVEAEDLAQDTFAEAFRSIRRFEGRSSLRTWLIGIARFQCLRLRRTRSRWVTGVGSDARAPTRAIDARIEACIDATRMLARCDAVLADRVGPTGRSIFELHYGHARSVRSIASSLGRSKDAVKASLRRSRRLLWLDLVASSGDPRGELAARGVGRPTHAPAMVAGGDATVAAKRGASPDRTDAVDGRRPRIGVT